MDKEKNPNMEARELINPLIYEDKSGKTLKSGFVFYDKKLDLTKELPEFDQMTVLLENINWKDVPQQNYSTYFPEDYLNHMLRKVGSIQESTEIHINPHIATMEKNNNVVMDVKEDEKLTPYEIMSQLLVKKRIIIINNAFYVYSGISYVPKTHIEIARLIMNECRELIKTKSSSFIDGVVNLLLKEPEICVSEMEIPHKFLAFQNCVLDLENRKILKHSKDYITLYEIKANYSNKSNQNTPVFDKFLSTITGGDVVLCERIMQMIGYILTPDVNAKCLFLLQGVSNSGKSVLANLLQKLFSDNAVMQLDIRTFKEKFSLGNLVGKAICSSADLPALTLDEATVSKLKQLTGNDAVSSDVKFSSFVKFVCYAKLILATNHALVTRTVDDAFWYRVCTIPFKYSVPREEQNYDLEKELYYERDAIVSKAMDAYFRLVDNHYKFAGSYQPNETVGSNPTNYDNIRANVYSFIKNYFVKSDDGIVFTDDALIVFCKQYCSIGINEFSQLFAEYGEKEYSVTRKRKRKNGAKNATSCFCGIKWRDGHYEKN